jgi:hypothetical protein
MKKTIISLGVILAVAIACQVNEPETTPETPGATSEAALEGEIFTVAEKPTAFPGGKEAWATFIQENLVIPDSNPQGKVFATFVVDKEGALHDIKLIRGIGKGADEAVIALLNKSPKWEVAEQRGQKVNMRMQVAIQFGEAEKDLVPAPPKPSIEDMNAGFDQVFMVVEEQAVFPGGQQAWADYVKDNLKTPDSNVKGKVFATFIVDKQGSLNNIQLIRGIGGGADEAVLELLQNSPNWQAGKQRGREVNSRMQIAISFK